MPTYEFRCPEGHEFERFYKTISTAPSEAQCPECGATSGRMMSAGAGLVFKGSGFYLTDYGKNAHRGAAPEKKGDDSAAAAKGDGAPAKDGAAAKADSASKVESKAKAEGPAKTESAQKSEAAKPKSEKSESAKPKASKPKSE